MSNYTSNDIINAIAAAAKALEARKDEINRLNVFPVPDGDTGTNMSLTLAMVVDNLAKLPIGASSEDRRRAITTGSYGRTRQFGRYYLSDHARLVRRHCRP